MASLLSDIRHGNINLKIKLSDNTKNPDLLTFDSPDDDFYFKEIVNTTYYPADEANWIIGQVHTKTTTSHVTDTNIPDQSKSVSYDYYLSGEAHFPLLKRETVFPGLSKSLTSEYSSYDDYGNILITTVSAPNYTPPIAAGTTTFEYSPDYNHRFCTKTIKTFGGQQHYEEKEYDALTGNITKSTDMNGLETSCFYDSFGRLNKTIEPDGNITMKHLYWKGSETEAPADAMYYSWVCSSGNKPVIVYYDAKGRELRTITVAMNGEDVYNDKTYDTRGRLEYTYDPYYYGQNRESYVQNAYDNLNRIQSITYSETSIPPTQYLYNGCTTSVTKGDQTTSKTINAAGWLIESADVMGGKLKYTYRSDGLLASTYLDGHPETAITKTYDAYGFCTQLTDPDAGTIAYDCTPFGEIAIQSENDNKEIYFYYDNLGRQATRNTYINNTLNETVTWHYDTQPHGIGMLASVSRNDGYSQSYAYDDLGRLASTTEHIKELDNQFHDYSTSQEYDVYGRLKTMLYPSTDPAKRFALNYGYDQQGFLTRIYRNSDNKTMWQTTEVNEKGLLTKYNMGEHLSAEQGYDTETDLLNYTTVKQDNSIVRQDYEYGWYKNTGNLEWRKKYLSSDRSTWVKEQFGYDDLNRLETVNRSSNANTTPVTTLTMVYTPDGTGNIHTKTGIGEYAYDPNRVHAVTSVENTGGIISTVPQGIEYTAFNKTKHIGEIPYTLDITYNTSDERITQVINNNGSLYQSKVYVGGMYEKITDANGTREVCYLSGPDGWFATYTIYADEHSETNYILKDHLGSVNYVLNEDGTVKQELSFDAWGNRRNPNTWQPFTGTPPEAVTDRGFTGHEHLYVFGLINMNGRVYDPILGRMLSPDNYVQAPDNTQNLNRYSYCLNNPLIYTDPSGESFMMLSLTLAFITDYASNLINGWHDPLGTAYTNATTTINGMNNCARIQIYNDDKNLATVGIDPFNFGISADYSHREGDFTFQGSAGYSCISKAYFDINLTYQSGDFTFTLGGGYSSGNNYTPGSSRFYGGMTYYDEVNKQSFSVGYTHFGGENAQNNWFVGYKKGDFSFSMTNDVKVGGDKFRTAAAEIGIGNFSYGMNLYTTEPPESEYNSTPQIGKDKNFKSCFWGKNSHGTYSSGSRIYAGMYLGYRIGNRVSRIGIDSPLVQAFFQNGIHRLPFVKSPDYNTTYGPPTRLFYQSGYYFPYSLYLN